MTELNLPARISASQIRCLHDCWRKYAYRYGMGIKDQNADAEYFVIGRVFDDLVHGKQTIDLVDLRPLDESKKDYRGMLKGMLESVRAKLDTSKLCCPEFEIKTDDETMRIDGIYADDDGWWICEFKTPSARGFDIEQKKQLLQLDIQIAAYLSRVKWIADHLYLSPEDFKGVKYFWCLKPASEKNPKYETHVWEFTASEIRDPDATWRNAVDYAKFAQQAIKKALEKRRDPFDVPCNPNSCATLTGVCGYYDQCYKRTASMGDAAQ